MTNRRIGILQLARLNSKRVPGKMLATVGGERLIDRGLRLLQRVRDQTGTVPFLGCCYADIPLWDAAAAHEIEVVEMSNFAAGAEAWNDCFGEFLAKVAGRFDWIIDGNFLCRPFLTVNTVVRIVDRARVADQPFVVTREHRGLLWDGTGRQIHGHGETANTKTNPVYHDLAHLGYALPSEFLADEVAMLKRGVEPFPVNLSPAECIDVDSPADLDFARTVAKEIEADDSQKFSFLCQ